MSFKKNNKFINLYLMGYKGMKSLDYFVNNKKVHLISGVCLSRDPNVLCDYFDQILNICRHHDIKVFLKEEQKEMPKADFSIAISWRWIINNEPKLIVLHDSILPKYRGFAPLVTQIIEKEKNLGVTAIFANDSYDEGDIIYSSNIQIDYPITIMEAIEKVCFCYFECLKQILYIIENNINFKVKKQEDSKATYSLWRDKEDYFINWNWPIDKICRFIDALGFPYQGAKSFLEKDIVLIDKVKIMKNVFIHNRDIGKIIFIKKSKPVVVCKDGLIKILKARYYETNESIIPLKKFRVRFK